MKRLLFIATFVPLSACYSWNTMTPASPLGYGNKEFMGYYGVNVSPTPQSTAADGPMGLRLRLGSSATTDLMVGFAFERPCNPTNDGNIANECPPGTTNDPSGTTAVYRLEVARQQTYVESQGFYLSQGEGMGVGIMTHTQAGSLPLALGPATWFTVSYVPINEVEIYVSGRLSGDIGVALGIRGRYSKFVGVFELGYYVPLLLDLFNTGQNGATQTSLFGLPHTGISFALGYADDGRKTTMFGPAAPSPHAPSLPPPPPPPPISPPPPPPPVNAPTYSPNPPAPSAVPPPPPPAPATSAPAPAPVSDVPLAPSPSSPAPSPSSTPPIPTKP